MYVEIILIPILSCLETRNISFHSIVGFDCPMSEYIFVVSSVRLIGKDSLRNHNWQHRRAWSLRPVLVRESPQLPWTSLYRRYYRPTVTQRRPKHYFRRSSRTCSRCGESGGELHTQFLHLKKNDFTRFIEKRF